jgi:hypothetical protein
VVNIKVIHIMYSMVTRIWLIPVIGSRGNWREGICISYIDRGLVLKCVSRVQSLRIILRFKSFTILLSISLYFAN